MSLSRQNKDNPNGDLFGGLCNEDLNAFDRGLLRDALAGNVDAQHEYVRYMDLQAMIRQHAESLDDHDFALRETQAALDALHFSTTDDAARLSDGNRLPTIVSFGRLFAASRNRRVWAAAAVILLAALLVVIPKRPRESTAPQQMVLAVESTVTSEPEAVANLRGTVGARWAGLRLELPEGEDFTASERIELVEGLAEICFGNGARVVLQGPAIAEIKDEQSIDIAVGRFAAVVPHSAGEFHVQTVAADFRGSGNEYGAEIDVDGSLATQVYLGEVQLQFHRGTAGPPQLQLASGQGAIIDAASGRATRLPQPNELHFVRYLPHREMRVNLAEVVAGSDATANAFHHGINLLDGEAVTDYGAPVTGDGKYKFTQSVEFVDGVFLPNGKLGATQVDSIGRMFGFPVTAGDCWGGAIMTRRPRYESSLPLIRLEFHGNNYGYVNWLHIASKSDELTPQGLGLIGMHSNSGITFDLHAIRARYPDKRVLRFRSVVGNLESRLEAGEESHTAEAWVLVDGQLRHHRKGFNRESGLQEIDIPLADRDRFLVLAVTDDGGETAYDWVAFGDAVIELTNVDTITNRNAPRFEPKDKTLGDKPGTGSKGEVGTNHQPEMEFIVAGQERTKLAVASAAL